MKRLALVVLLAVSIPAAVFAATTFTSGQDRARVAFTTGTETCPADTNTTAGINLAGLEGLQVVVEASGAMVAGSKLIACYRNPVTGNWSQAPDSDLSVQALARQTFAGLRVPAGVGRIVYVPSGLGSVTGTIDLIGVRR